MRVFYINNFEISRILIIFSFCRGYVVYTVQESFNEWIPLQRRDPGEFVSGEIHVIVESDVSKV